MYVLAHLSDPHLAPLPTPRLTEAFERRFGVTASLFRELHATVVDETQQL